MIRAARAAAILVGLGSSGCFGSAPDLQYYQLVPAVSAAPRAPSELVIAVEPFEVDAAYDDERIVYRPSPYRLSYYHYHRWSSTPGVQIADFLRAAYERSGLFRQVGSDVDPGTRLLVSGRVSAFEEVDESETSWVGRVRLDLLVRDVESGELLLAQAIEETEPLADQHPEGLARALSAALSRVALRTAPLLVELAQRAERRAGAQ